MKRRPSRRIPAVAALLSLSLGLPPSALALRPRAAGEEEPTFVTAELRTALAGAEEPKGSKQRVQRLAQILASVTGRTEKDPELLIAAEVMERSARLPQEAILARMVVALHEKLREGGITRETLDQILRLLPKGPLYAEWQGILPENYKNNHQKSQWDLEFRNRISDNMVSEQIVVLARAQLKGFHFPFTRWMIRRDMLEVLDIEQRSFEYAWSEEDFLRALRQRNCIGMVAEHGEKVVGFMIYELHKNKLHFLNFAVDPNWRNQGVGASMVAKLVSKLSSHRRTRITLEVRETNLPAQLFFRQMGFRAVNVLRNFYDDPGEDAILMEYRIERVPEEEEAKPQEIPPAASKPGDLPAASEPGDLAEPALHSGPASTEREEAPRQLAAPALEFSDESERMEQYTDVVADEPAEFQEETGERAGGGFQIGAMEPDDSGAAARILDSSERRGRYGRRRWDRARFERILSREGINGLAVRDPESGTLAGFAVLWERGGGRRTLLSFAVAPEHRGKGVGKRLLDAIKKSALPGPASLEVHLRGKEKTAQEFFMAEGFEAVDTLRGFFADPEEDAVRMEWSALIQGTGLEEQASLSEEVSEQQNYRLAVFSSE